MTATVVGPGGAVEIDNSDAVPIEVTIVGGGVGGGLTDAELRASEVPVVDDDVAALLTAIGAVLSAISTELAAKLEPGQQVALDAASLAALESITAAVSGTVAVSGSVEVANDVGNPLPVSAVDLDVRDLSELTDAVRSVDAAEDAALVAVPFTIAATGTATLVAAPGVGNGRLRLRRLSPTYAIRSPASEPILALFVGAVEAQRGNALTGRFDITAAAETDAITLTVDVLDAAGRVTGTVYYEVTP